MENLAHASGQYNMYILIRIYILTYNTRTAHVIMLRRKTIVIIIIINIVTSNRPPRESRLRKILYRRLPPRLPPRPGRLAVHQRMRVRRQDHLLGLAAATAAAAARLLVGARLAVPHQHGHGHASGRRQSAGRGRRVMVRVHALLLLRPLRLVPVVLEPDLHLEQRAAVPSVLENSVRGNITRVTCKQKIQINRLLTMSASLYGDDRPLGGTCCAKNHKNHLRF